MNIANYYPFDDPEGPEIPDFGQIDIPGSLEANQDANPDDLLRISLNLYYEPSQEIDFLELSNLDGLSYSQEKAQNSENINTQTTQNPAVEASKTKPTKKKTSLRPPKIIHRRWGKKEDKALFQILRNMEKEGFFTLDDLLQLDTDIDLSCHEGIQEL